MLSEYLNILLILFFDKSYSLSSPLCIAFRADCGYICYSNYSKDPETLLRLAVSASDLQVAKRRSLDP